MDIENFFHIGDYAEIVCHMFDGCCGYVYYVDYKEERIWLSAGVTSPFYGAWDLTLNSDKETNYHKNKIRKGKDIKKFFKQNKYIIPSDMYLQDWKRKLLWFLRKIIFSLLNRIDKNFNWYEWQLKKIEEWENEIKN